MISTIQKLLDLLNPREKRQALLLLAMMLVLGVVEMAGVASIFPLIAVLSNPELIRENEYLRFVYETLGFSSNNSFFIFLSASVFAIIVVRTGLTAITSYATLRYAQMRSHSLSVRLLGSYLRRPYSFFLNRHSADMGKSVLSEVEQVVGGSLMPMFRLASRLIISSLIIAVVVAVEPTISIIAFSGMIGAYGVIYYAVRGFLHRKGHERLSANRKRFQLAQEVLAGVKEVKIGGHERAYLRRFETASETFARLKRQINLVREVPRYLLELISIGGIIGVVLLLLFRAEGELSDALPTIGLYAFAAMRLMPSLQTLYKAIVALRFGGAALDALHNDLLEADNMVDLELGPTMHLKQNICLSDASFAYPNTELRALHDISLMIPAYSTVGVVGATGAGKSTLVDLILGLLEPQSGKLKIDDELITRNNVRSWQTLVGYVPQQIFLTDESIAANIALGVSPGKIDMVAVRQAAKLANLHEFIISKLPDGYDTEVGDRGVRLSGGQRQRVGIARALYSDPSILVLDEATSSLDNLTEKAVMEAVRNIGGKKTIIMIAHRLSTVKNADIIFFLENGRLKFSGNYDSLLTSSSEFGKLVKASN